GRGALRRQAAPLGANAAVGPRRCGSARRVVDRIEMSIEKLRAREAEALANDGKIDDAEAKALVDGAKPTDERQAAAEMVARDNFELGGRTQSYVTQRLGRPIAKAPLVGLRIGAAGDAGAPVFVRKTLSPAAGFANEYQALATARLSGSDRAVVVQGANG